MSIARESIIERIEKCHPGLVLVEGSSSNDILESLLGKGITVVNKMKLHRLKRVARCTGSSILSVDTLCGDKIGTCNFFHVQKFEEEHAPFSESGNRQAKNLLVLEGFQTCLGCTVSFFHFLILTLFSPDLFKLIYA